jgi:hypothetical protein
LAYVRSLTRVTLASTTLVALVALFTLAAPADQAFAKTVSLCQETQLDVRWAPGGGGLGHGAYLIEIRNISSSACRLSGYPMVRMTVGVSTVSVVAKKTRNGYMGGVGGSSATAPLPVVTLRAHGGEASSMVEGTTIPVGNDRKCVVYTRVSITLAEMKPPYRFAIRFSGCVRPAVHPVVKGLSGSSR